MHAIALHPCAACPITRWGATSFLYADHLWVFSGTATAGNKPCMSDVWRFSLAARAWTEVQQRGATPHRGWGGSANGWDRAARHGGFLLAFGEAKVGTASMLHTTRLRAHIWRS